MSIFICPICKNELYFDENRAFCKNNHSFDKAKEGYYHFLMCNKMHSKIPGDTKEMVTARRSFLNKGYYDIFSKKLNEIVKGYIKPEDVILDAGSGEGYYTKRLFDCLNESNIDFSLYGIDISKFAVKYASKTEKNINYAVSSIFDMPVKDNSTDILVNIFAPIVPNEFKRVLKKNGKLIIAVPGEYHLWGLKTIVYDKPYVNEYKDTFYDGFTFLDRISVKGEISLNGNVDIENLFSMTPYYWKTDIIGSERVKNCNKLETLIHFDYLVYEKTCIE